jgi:hypothetical protein
MVKYDPKILREQIEAFVRDLMANYPTVEMHLEKGITDPADWHHFTLDEAKGVALNIIRERFVAPIQGEKND